MIPGEIKVGQDKIILNEGRKKIKITVQNTGDRPVQIGSHYHFYEVNPALSFNREVTKGYRLNIASGTAVRFEPSQARSVELVEYAGSKTIFGFRGEIMGPLAESHSNTFGNEQIKDYASDHEASMDRESYAQMFGPTTGDQVRLANTDIWIQVENDLATYGDEVKFGGGKVIRDGMGQSQVTREHSVDLVITNALILDYWGIVKADVGVKDGRIYKVGKAGNPDIQDDVTINIGPGTEVIAGEGSILTAGGIDAHIHFICPNK